MITITNTMTNTDFLGKGQINNLKIRGRVEGAFGKYLLAEGSHLPLENYRRQLLPSVCRRPKTEGYREDDVVVDRPSVS